LAKTAYSAAAEQGVAAPAGEPAERGLVLLPPGEPGAQGAGAELARGPGARRAPEVELARGPEGSAETLVELVRVSEALAASEVEPAGPVEYSAGDRRERVEYASHRLPAAPRQAGAGLGAV